MSPEDMEDNPKTKRKESIPVEIIFQPPGEENKKASNIGTKYSNDVDHQPGYEEVWLILVYSRYGKNIADNVHEETEELTDHRDDLM